MVATTAFAAAFTAFATAFALLLSGCTQAPPPTLGSLEYDRITLPAAASERIVEVKVREGEPVQADQPIMRLDPVRADAQVASAQADLARLRASLVEAQRGPRQESIEQARAQFEAAQAQARDARARLDRYEPLGRSGTVSAATMDQTRTAWQAAAAQAEAAAQALDALVHGTRPEQIEQAQAAVAAAQAQVRLQEATRARLDVVAPRAGRIDTLPYRLGDQPAAGAPLAVLLVGDAPYARIYVRQPQRAALSVGSKVRIDVDGPTAQHSFVGTVRMIRNEPVFTPYFALTGSDAQRLSYLAEVQLGADASGLPAGLPVTARLEQP